MWTSVKDLKTTIPGFVLAFILIVAVFTRKDWSGQDMAVFAAAVGVALLGAFSRSPKRASGDKTAPHDGKAQ